MYIYVCTYAGIYTYIYVHVYVYIRAGKLGLFHVTLVRAPNFTGNGYTLSPSQSPHTPLSR